MVWCSRTVRSVGRGIGKQFARSDGDFEVGIAQKRLEGAIEFAILAIHTISKKCLGIGGSGSAHIAKRRSCAKGYEKTRIYRIPTASRNIENLNHSHSSHAKS